MLPFLFVGIWSLIGAIGVFFTVPSVDNNKHVDEITGKTLTMMDFSRVSYTVNIYCVTIGGDKLTDNGREYCQF